MKPVIGITATNLITDNSLSERSCVNVDYIAAVSAAGGTPIVLPVVTDDDLIANQARLIDGLLVTGGDDIHPLLYGEEPYDKLEFVDPDRDRHESKLVRLASDLKKPIFGICRGIQLINVVFGGTLYQDLSQSPDAYIKHKQKSRRSVAGHTVDIVSDSVLYTLFGEFVMTNSFHHQAVKDLAEGFTVTARAKDGIIEGIERQQDSSILAVQWHPENMVERYPVMLELFKWLINQAEKPQ